MLFQANQQIGNYTLIKPLGEGGFGEVWLAENHNNPSSEKVAIKLPRKEQIDLQAVKDEIFNWTLSGKHKNILPIIECETFGNQIAIVSEFAPDGSLQDWLKKHRVFSVADAVEIIIGILDGLTHLHNRKIIHRDLKPDNVLFQGRTPRLTDFGISRALPVGSKSATISGTMSYMAPEAFDGKRNKQTDIWSVGVILYQLLSGNLPFPQREQTELMGAIVMREPNALSDSVPPDVQNIVKKSLAKSPSERFQTADKMKDDLKEILRTWESSKPEPILDEPNPFQPVDNLLESANDTIIDEGFDNNELPEVELNQNRGTIETNKKLQPDEKEKQGQVGQVIRQGKTEEKQQQQVRNVKELDYLKRDDDCAENDYYCKIEHYSKAIDLNPNFAIAYYNRANAYYELGNYDRAINDYNKAIELKTDFAEAYFGQGDVSRANGNYDQAINYYTRAIELKPLKEFYTNRGIVYSDKGNYEQAIWDYNKAIELNPNYAIAYNNLGNTYDEKGNYEKAFSNYNKAIELNPNYADAYNNRGNIYRKKGDFDQAFKDYTKAIEMMPDSVIFYSNRGKVNIRKGNYEQAIKDFNRAIELEPDCSVAYANRAVAYYEKSNYDKAITDSRKALQIDPNNKLAKDNLEVMLEEGKNNQ